MRIQLNFLVQLTSLVAVLLMMGAAAPQSRAVRRDPAAAAETVRAATERAIDALYGEVSGLRVAEDVTIETFLVDLGVKDRFVRETLYRADQIGSPRWVDEHTCQVRLEIPTFRITADLKRFATANPKNAPATPEEIDRAAEQWPRRAYEAVGSSAGPQKLELIKPVTGPRWGSVNDTDRQKALKAASAEAARNVLASVKGVSLGNRLSLGDALAQQEISSPIADWLYQRPISRVDFRDDLQVEVTLGLERKEFFNLVRSVLERQQQVKISADWSQVERDMNASLKPATGRAAVNVGAAQPPAQIELPAQPPDWVGQQWDVRGNAASVGDKLRTRAAAERDALGRLRERIETLPLAADLTIGEAARRDADIAQAVTRALREAHAYKTDYRTDGSVVVQMTFETREVWEELRR